MEFPSLNIKIKIKFFISEEKDIFRILINYTFV